MYRTIQRRSILTSHAISSIILCAWSRCIFLFFQLAKFYISEPRAHPPNTHTHCSCCLHAFTTPFLLNSTLLVFEQQLITSLGSLPFLSKTSGDPIIVAEPGVFFPSQVSLQLQSLCNMRPPQLDDSFNL